MPIVLWRDLVTFLAAIILFVSFLLGPFVQQASRTVDCTIVDAGGKASLPFAHFVPRQGGFVDDCGGCDQGVPAPDLMATLLSVVTAPGKVENQIRGSCSTGKCTFPKGDSTQPGKGGNTDEETTTHSTVAMCNKCVDVMSLVRSGTNADCPSTDLPNKISLRGSCGGSFDLIQTQSDPDLSWMGDLLTPEIKSASRQAYVNVSVLALGEWGNTTAVAMMCNLYPCIRSYQSSITNNEVSEVEMGSKPMQLDLLWRNENVYDNDVLWMPVQNILGNRFVSYTAVQTPCRVEGQTYDMTVNKSVDVNCTKLALYDFTDFDGSHNYTSMNITAPVKCIYRQHPQFVIAVSRLLNKEIFNGSCHYYKQVSCQKGGDSERDRSYIPGLGAETVLRSLYNDGYSGVANVTKWFDTFADTMTKRYRTDYGTPDGGGDEYSRMVDLPLDEIQGVAWRRTTCVSMRRVWLLLPIILTTVATILAIWTIVSNWRHRRTRLVWKDDILPLLFYGRDIMDDALDPHTHRTNKTASHQDETRDQDKERRLLEAKEMKKISDSIPVTLRWLYDADASARDSSAEASSCHEGHTGSGAGKSTRTKPVTIICFSPT